MRSARARRRPARILGGLALTLAWLASDAVLAQDMEPRRWTHLPSGLTVLGTGLGATYGDIFFDPVLRIEDATFELYTVGGSYIHSFEWLGKSTRVDLRQPYAYGRWEGLVDGEYTAVRRHGLMDPRVRLSMNLWGAPPLSGKAYVDYRARHQVNTTVGAAVSLTLPLGEYYPERLINLGQNRYIARAQLGALHQRGPWQFELTGTISFYQDNEEFFGGTRLTQDPLGFLQAHVIRAFPRGVWGSVSGGYSYGGESQIDGEPKNNDERTRYLALSVGMPLNRQQSVTLTYLNADTNVLLGTSSDSLLFSWSVAWSD
jgi:hypothetical protein